MKLKTELDYLAAKSPPIEITPASVESLVAASEEDSCRYGNAISLHSAEVTILCCVVH